MKKGRNLGILLVFIASIFFSSCSGISGNQTKTNASTSDQNSANAANNTAGTVINNSTKKDYINVKYLFRVSYPKEWADAVESETQDGALLYYVGDNDVRVFADKADKGYIDNQKDQAEAEDKKVNNITSNDGVKGIIITGDNNGKKLTHIIYVNNGTHFDFYALVKGDFDRQNSNNFLDIAKSIKLLSK